MNDVVKTTHNQMVRSYFSGTFAVARTYDIQNSCVLPTVAVVLSSA